MGLPPRIINLSITFLSSLTFPDQSYSSNNLRESLLNSLVSIPCSLEINSEKCETKIGISDFLLLSSGTSIRITANL